MQSVYKKTTPKPIKRISTKRDLFKKKKNNGAISKVKIVFKVILEKIKGLFASLKEKAARLIDGIAIKLGMKHVDPGFIESAIIQIKSIITITVSVSSLVSTAIKCIKTMQGIKKQYGFIDV